MSTCSGVNIKLQREIVISEIFVKTQLVTVSYMKKQFITTLRKDHAFIIHE